MDFVHVVKKGTRLNQMVQVSTIVAVVASPSRSLDPEDCPDCGCPMDEHKGNFCMNCGEECETGD